MSSCNTVSKKLENLSSIERLLREIWDEQTKQGAKASETHDVLTIISSFSMRSAGNLHYLKELGLRQEGTQWARDSRSSADTQRLLGEIWAQQRGRVGTRLPLLGQGLPATFEWPLAGLIVRPNERSAASAGQAADHGRQKYASTA